MPALSLPPTISIFAGLKEPSATRIGRVCIECKIHLGARTHCTAHRHFAKRQAEKWNGKLWLTVCFSNNAASGFASSWLRAHASRETRRANTTCLSSDLRKKAQRANKRCLYACALRACVCERASEWSKLPNYANAARAHRQNFRQKPLPGTNTFLGKPASSLKMRRGVCRRAQMQTADSQVLY
jgi:hypothetical protein